VIDLLREDPITLRFTRLHPPFLVIDMCSTRFHYKSGAIDTPHPEQV